MKNDTAELQASLVSIASEMFRFQHVFEKIVSRLEIDEQKKYLSQYAWFSKRVYQALDLAGLRLIDITGELYDPGMAVSALNLEDFDANDTLFVVQMMEPIIMCGTEIAKIGTVILGRIER